MRISGEEAERQRVRLCRQKRLRAEKLKALKLAEQKQRAVTWNGFLHRARDGDVAAMQCLVRLEIDHGSKDESGAAKLAERTGSRSGEANAAGA